MKKTILICLLFIPSCLFGFGKKEKQIYNYLTSIDGMKVQEIEKKDINYTNVFVYQDYQSLGFEEYGKRNPKYAAYLEDIQVRNIIEMLNSYLTESQFIVLNNKFYFTYDNELRCYLLDTGKLTDVFILDDFFYYNSYFSQTTHCFYYINNIGEFIKIDLDTMHEEMRLFIGDLFLNGELSECESLGKDYIIGINGKKSDRSIYLFSFESTEKQLIINLSPVCISTGMGAYSGVGDLFIKNNKTICFYVAAYHKLFFCEYTIPKEYLTSSSE